MIGELYIGKAGTDEMRKADSLDRDFLANAVLDHNYHKIIVNDEKLEDGATLLTVTPKAWQEMKDLG